MLLSFSLDLRKVKLLHDQLSLYVSNFRGVRQDKKSKDFKIFFSIYTKIFYFVISVQNFIIRALKFLSNLFSKNKQNTLFIIIFQDKLSLYITAHQLSQELNRELCSSELMLLLTVRLHVTKGAAVDYLYKILFMPSLIIPVILLIISFLLFQMQRIFAWKNV